MILGFRQVNVAAPETATKPIAAESPRSGAPFAPGEVWTAG